MKVKSYLEQLLLRFPQKPENSEKGPPPLPPKLTEPGFGGFGGEEGGHISEFGAESKSEEATPPRGVFEDIKLVLDAFPGATSAGIWPKGTFQGPMLKLPDLGRCPVSTNTKHWRVVDGQKICALCAEGGPGEIVGSRFLAALKWSDKKESR